MDNATAHRLEEPPPMDETLHTTAPALPWHVRWDYAAGSVVHVIRIGCDCTAPELPAGSTAAVVPRAPILTGAWVAVRDAGDGHGASSVGLLRATCKRRGARLRVDLRTPTGRRYNGPARIIGPVVAALGAEHGGRWFAEAPGTAADAPGRPLPLYARASAAELPHSGEAVLRVIDGGRRGDLAER